MRIASKRQICLLKATQDSQLLSSVLNERSEPLSLLWENTDTIVTDAATMNLSIEELIFRGE